MKAYLTGELLNCEQFEGFNYAACIEVFPQKGRGRCGMYKENDKLMFQPSNGLLKPREVSVGDWVTHHRKGRNVVIFTDTRFRELYTVLL